MPKSLRDAPPHPMRALLPPMAAMRLLGFTPQQCLAGTGISPCELEDGVDLINLDQELRFYRNVLELTGDRAVGLKLGEQFLPQHYGLFGYALLSATTFRHALTIAEKYGRLTFSLFSFGFGVQGGTAWFSLADPPELAQELLDLYLDRDLSAARVVFETILGRPGLVKGVQLPHDGRGRAAAYPGHFGCKVQFNAPGARLEFEPDLLDLPLPHSDPESFRHLQLQCQMLIAKLQTRSRFVDDVRMLILERPGFFPDIESVAGKLRMSPRTLRRRLKDEGSSYRALLDELRYGLAREYLTNTALPMDEIARLLGYTEPGNFSHAFRRWSGQSPRAWRRAN